MKQNYIETIQSFYTEHNRLPSYREIADACEFSSVNAAYKLADRLIDAGYVRKDAKGKLVPTHKLTDLEVLGAVTAGFPTPADEEPVDTMSIDEFLVENREATYILTVDGSSMKDAGICEGDLVLVERTDSAKDGQIVIAEVDNEWTMKFLKKDSNTCYLVPANDDYSPIYPDSSLSVAGVVRGVVRKYS